MSYFFRTHFDEYLIRRGWTMAYFNFVLITLLLSIVKYDNGYRFTEVKNNITTSTPIECKFI